MYQVLAKYYDILTDDQDAMKQWLNFVELHHNGGNILELACGSGTLAKLLADKHYKIEASDISKDMINIARDKLKGTNVNIYEFNMINIQLDKNYDNIICFCDSINYLETNDDVKRMFKSVYEHLNDQGVFMFDIHSIDRLDEFKDEFFEEGLIGSNSYEWSITTMDDSLYHQFVFYNEDGIPTVENQIQRVYDIKFIEEILVECGFSYKVYTDFDKKGIVAGEKYFYVATKD
ncbi:MAG: class I SAM-dependent methyltransferase [Erysipelotrichaceae bacterium]